MIMSLAITGCGSDANSDSKTTTTTTTNQSNETEGTTNNDATEAPDFENKELNIAIFEGGYGPDYWTENVTLFEGCLSLVSLLKCK